MKKTSAIIATGSLLLMTLFASGCGNQYVNSSSAETKPEKKEEKKTINYPAKPIEIIVPFAAGGGTDIMWRALAESMKTVLGQDVVIVNKTGGSGAVGMNEGLQAKPDGYKLTAANREIAALPVLGLAPFKTFDFKFIGKVNTDPAMVVVSSKSKYQTFEELVADIKANPGKLNFASSSTPSYYGIPFAEAADLDFVTIPFQGTGQAIIEVLGGRAEFGIYGIGEVKNHIESGGLRPLALMADKRAEGYFKDVPTMKEKGINVIAHAYRGLAAPGGTPDEIIKILEDALAKAVKDPKFIAFMNKQNLFIDYQNGADFKKMLEQDLKDLEVVAEVVKRQK
ncbi:tripartite tricarboxylate transporter substrate binding protein [Paenibacillus naphthalenovorans]|uniref:Tripartite tricarboxylate transporter family receptor n=1 Tax=Paenibacillus naphthalenovorans TaxID=162209 RepID=A0A0U2WHY7_9BACL|nr:tripartite tricarboxylate transporter substrate binding protein [Paenibacillus naphthalenovorans]ALS24922.1 tripartite tricarboxylate transporter family receptor [Paenibacillus naphthalenovorans]